MINIEAFRVNKMVLLLSVIRKMKFVPFDGDARFSKVIKAARVFTNAPSIYKELLEDNKLMSDLLPILESDVFESLYEEALKYRDEVATKWKKLEPIISDYCTSVLGFMDEKKILVNIVNPRFNTGTNDMKDEIFWGHTTGRKDISYDATYIMHESMHCVYPKEKEWSEEQYGVCHSLIELAIDNELRSRLGGDNKNYSQGHYDAEKIRKRLMPLWIVFLSQKGGASDFKIPKDKKFEKYMNMAQNYNVQNMRFTELMNYCVEHYREYGLDENAFKWKKNETSYDR